MEYSKHFIPLESDPDIFTSLIHDLGASPDLCFVDVWDIDDPAQLALIHRPVLALILVFPTSDIYERHKKSQKVDVESYGNGEGEEDILWFKQIINNACGLYAILHAVLNGDARRFIQPSSTLASLLDSCRTLPPSEFANVLLNSEELENAYSKAARQGSSQAPNAEDEVDYHYVCFVKSSTGDLLELDGDLDGPVRRQGILNRDDDVLAESGLNAIREYVSRENGLNLNFGILPLTSSVEENSGMNIEYDNSKKD